LIPGVGEAGGCGDEPVAARSSASMSPKMSRAMPMTAMSASILSSLRRKTGRTLGVCFEVAVVLLHDPLVLIGRQDVQRAFGW
jgi:hypothetical protein